MTHKPKGILAFDPAYGVGASAGLVYIEPFDDGNYDVDWVEITPKAPEPKPGEKRRTLKSLTKDERMESVLEQINTFAQQYIHDISTLATYKTAFGGAALGRSHQVGIFRGWGWMNDIVDYQAFSDKTIKKAIIGNGNATKAQVRDAIVKGRLGQSPLWKNCPESLDVSDAFAVGYYVVGRRRCGTKK